jgi:hypothetical protein
LSLRQCHAQDRHAVSGFGIIFGRHLWSVVSTPGKVRHRRPLTRRRRLPVGDERVCRLDGRRSSQHVAAGGERLAGYKPEPHGPSAFLLYQAPEIATQVFRIARWHSATYATNCRAFTASRWASP